MASHDPLAEFRRRLEAVLAWAKSREHFSALDIGWMEQQLIAAYDQLIRMRSATVPAPPASELEAPPTTEPPAPAERPPEEESPQAPPPSSGPEADPSPPPPSGTETQRKTLADLLRKQKVQSLQKAIPLHHKAMFVKRLFGGDVRAYERALRFLESCKQLAEARTYLEQEVAPQYGWTPHSETYRELLEYLKVRFS